MPEEDPLIKYGSPLAAVLIAVVLSIMLAATVAGQLGGSYETRAGVYTGFVLWVLLGAAVMFVLAHRGESGRFSAARVLLWVATIWLWPLFMLMYLRRKNPPSQ